MAIKMQDILRKYIEESLSCLHKQVLKALYSSILVRQQEMRENLSDQLPVLIGWTQESHQLGQQISCGATEDFKS